MDDTHVLRAAAECHAFLEPNVDADWTRRIPGMTWTVADTVAHIAHGLLWYAHDLVAGQRELSAITLSTKDDATPADLVATLDAFAVVLARVVAGTPADLRGWHPFGQVDASGFAAMGCDEMLLHTYDAALGLERDFTPSAELAEATLRRLFPWAPTNVDPWPALLWANGRLDLPGHERQTNWRWHCAPLDEWDGVNPRERR